MCLVQGKLQPAVDVTFLFEIGAIEHQVRAAPGNVSEERAERMAVLPEA